MSTLMCSHLILCYNITMTIFLLNETYFLCYCKLIRLKRKSQILPYTIDSNTVVVIMTKTFICLSFGRILSHISTKYILEFHNVKIISF